MRCRALAVGGVAANDAAKTVAVGPIGRVPDLLFAVLPHGGERGQTRAARSD